MGERGAMPTRKGACRCGRVQITLSAAPLLTMACHCTGCQRMTGSAFSLSVAVPSEGFAVSGGETVVGGLRGASRHHFCPHCMSWLFTRPEGMDEFVNLRTTMLEVPSDLPPFIETWTSEKLSWARTPAAHSCPGFPEPDAFGGLVQAYPSWAAAAAAAS